MDPVEQAKSEMGSIEKFVAKLPGIKGYREKELRRDADKQVRGIGAPSGEPPPQADRAAKRSAIVRRAAVDGRYRAVVGRLQLLIDRLKTASYGYAPLWGLNRVKEDDLDRLIAFDQALFDEVGQLDEAIGTLETAVGANDQDEQAGPERVGESLRVAEVQPKALHVVAPLSLTRPPEGVGPNQLARVPGGPPADLQESRADSR